MRTPVTAFRPSTTTDSTLWLRLLRSFIFVSAVARFALPRAITSSTSCALDTGTLSAPATLPPLRCVLWMSSVVAAPGSTSRSRTCTGHDCISVRRNFQRRFKCAGRTSDWCCMLSRLSAKINEQVV